MATCLPEDSNLPEDVDVGSTVLQENITDGATNLQRSIPDSAYQKDGQDDVLSLQKDILGGATGLQKNPSAGTGLQEEISGGATCLQEDILDGATDLPSSSATGLQKNDPDNISGLQEDICNGTTSLKVNIADGATCLPKDIPDGATGLHDVPHVSILQEDIPGLQKNIFNGATSLQVNITDGDTCLPKDIPNSATGLQEDVLDGATDLQEDLPDGATGLQEDVPDGATGLQKNISGGATGPQDNIPHGATGLQEDSPGQVNGIEEPTTPTQIVDRFGFTGGKQFEENRDTHLPISVIRKRELKWLDMLEDWAKWMSKKPKKVKERCRKGIPSALRARAWQYLSGSKNLMEKKKLVFPELDAQDGDPKWVDLIEKDLDRQFPFHEMFAKGGGGQHDLFRILKAYSIYNPRDGYCQAQAPIAAVLVMQMPAEEAFWCLVQICEKYLVGYFSPGLEAMQIDGDVLLGLMKRHLPITYHHMVEQHIEPVHYMTEWFMCIYSRTFPFSSVLRVWDIFLCEGVKVLFKVALVIIKHTLSSKHQLEECPGFYETIQKLKHIPGHVVEEDFLINEVVEMRVFEKEFEAEHSLQVARRKAVKQRQLRHSNQVEMAKQVAEIKQKKKIKAKSKIQLKKPLSQSHGALNFLSSDYEDSAVAYSLPNTPSQRRLEERNVQKYSHSDSGGALPGKLNGSKAYSADELEFDEYLEDEVIQRSKNGLNETKKDGKVKKEKKKSKKKKVPTATLR